MLFTKSTPAVSRAALAKSKLFWGASPTNQGSNSPGFFVSTPQFTRHQQNQLSVYDDARGAGSSNSTSDQHGIESPYLALTAGGSSASGAPGVHFDDDAKDDGLARVQPGNKKVKPLSAVRQPASSQSGESFADTLSSSILTGGDLRADPVAEAIDQVGKVTVIQGMLEKMHRLHKAGSYGAVLATFEVLETIQHSLPTDAYNLVLESLASTCDINTQLEAYEKMLVRGVKPNDDTYCIILSSLINNAESLSAMRKELSPLLGKSEGMLESVDEIREGLAVEEYVLLAQNIVSALIAAHPQPWSAHLQDCIDRAISASLSYNIPVSDSLLAAASPQFVGKIDVQPNIQLAAQEFSALDPTDQQSEVAQQALLRSYFKFNEPSGAIAFFSGCGSPSYLLRPLLRGLVAKNYVGVVREWIDESDASSDVIADVLNSIPCTVESSQDVLPSATELFYKLVTRSGGGSGSGGNSNGRGNGDGKANYPLASEEDMTSQSVGRCAFIRLCISAKNADAFLMAVRESHYSNIPWDAVTINKATTYLSELGQPLLAADICRWQIPMLEQAYELKNLRGFVDQEVVSDLVNTLESRNQLSVDASLRILPVISRCPGTRKRVLQVIHSAKLDKPYELAELMNAERLSNTVRALCMIMICRPYRPTDVELPILAQLIPPFVQDALASRCEFGLQDALNIEQALSLCPQAEELLREWERNYLNERTLERSSLSEASLTIKHYAMSPNGFDHAVALLTDQFRLGKMISSDALNAVIDACFRCQATDLLPMLYENLPQSTGNLNTLLIAAAFAKNQILLQKCYDDLVHGLQTYPSLTAYTEMVNAEASNYKKALALFNEAKHRAKLPVGPELYNIIAMILANHLRHTEIAQVLAEMNECGFQLKPATYESILSMYVRLDQGHRSLQILKQMPLTTKSLLEVSIFNDMMSYFVRKLLDRQSALEVFMELRNTGTLATPLTYKFLMEAYLLRHKEDQHSLENADRVLSLMRKDGAPITNQCFATLLRARGVLYKDFEGARNFYRGLVKNSRVLPDRGIFQALLESYVTNGKQSEVKLVLDEMKKYHVPIDDQISKFVTISS